MQQLLTIWNALEPGKRIVVLIASVAVFATVLILSRVASTPSMALLYAGLESKVAAEIITSLDQGGIAYEIKGAAIYVDTARRDEVRISLAGEGLPGGQSSGYELLDGLSGFGTTSQMFDATYWRAKEGELARTVLSLPQVRAARVHIANPVSRPFSRKQKPTASVTLTMGAAGLSGSDANAIRYLIASAVTGLSPQDVSIIDSVRGLVSARDGGKTKGIDPATRSAELKQNVERLLAAHVGVGNAIVEVTIDTNLDQETFVEHRFDPESRVAISSDTEEITENSTDSGGGAVTVASNLPDGDQGNGDSSSNSTNSETRERINYEVSESTRELIKSPGTIKRMTVAVLVEGVQVADAAGNVTWSPRSEEDIATMRALVESAVGFNADRGDIVTVKSMQFLPVEELGALVERSAFDVLAVNLMTIVQLAVLAIVALVLSLFVIRPILTQRLPPAMPELPPPPPEGAPNVLAGASSAHASLGPPASGASQAAISTDPIVQLRQLIEDRQEDSAMVLRNWIDSSEESA